MLLDKTQRLLTTTMALGVIAGSVILPGVSARAGASGDNSPANEFAYVMVRSDVKTGKKMQSECNGVFLLPTVAVTAAHCIVEGAATLKIDCGAVAEGNPLREMRIDRIRRHPTLDIAAIVFARSGGDCDRQLQSIAIAEAGAGQNVVRITKEAPEYQSRSGAAIAGISALDTIDPYVLRIFEQDECLTMGDSGSGLFASDNEGSLLIIGILISGAPACPGEQTFVRLAPAKAWIESMAQETM